MRFYTPSHEWIEVEGNIATVGLTEAARQELGDVVYLQLPPLGAHLRAGEEACVVESTKAASDLYAPVSGKVVAVNEDLSKNISQWQSGGAANWLFKIELTNVKELIGLIKK